MTSPARRNTRQRAAVLSALDRTGVFVGAQQLHATLRGAGDGIGLATVYRSLQLLSEDGAVDVRRDQDGELTYRRCRSSNHHHHLVCRHCGRTVEVEARTVDTWAADVSRDNGFVDTSHTVEITGTCNSCAPTHSSPP